ncbi:sugar ABC transporter ATP-binding protein [Rhizobium sullae]|nr:sugar ABC transporter ATP-binding protein [Rhizobium sullae]
MNNTPPAVSAKGGFAGPAERAVLIAEQITKKFAGVTALADVSFDLRAGEIHALMGENGAGKSTLMKILSGVYSDYEGLLLLDGVPVHFASVREAENAGIAIIHQELNLVPELTVAENIFLGREPRFAGMFINRGLAARRTKTLLTRLGIDIDPDARVSSLRIGERQLVEIAKALSVNARILFMDEPTSALSPAECERLFVIIRQLAADGVAIVYISHRLEEVMALSDRVTVFRDGQHVWTRKRGDFNDAAIITAMVGRELLQSKAHSPRLGDVVLSARNLSLSVPRRHGWTDVLRDVSFDLRSGEILGIGGLLGSGRTEIFETIFGSARGRRSGQLKVAGKHVDVRSPVDAKRLGIGLVSEDRKAQGLHIHEAITENVALPLVGRLSRFGLRSFEKEAALARNAVRSLGVRCSGIEQLAGTLSGGNQQKIVIGKWLATAPIILLLDEPTRGIDVGAKREIYELVFALAGQGMAIAIVSSELPELLYLSDRIIVMSEGRLAGTLSHAEATEERIMQMAAPQGGLKRRATP